MNYNKDEKFQGRMQKYTINFNFKTVFLSKL